MVTSMTGFGRGTASDAAGEVTIEIQSVNNRFLDVTLRGGREATLLEGRIRESLRERLERGKITVTLTIQSAGEGEPEPDTTRARAYLDALRQIQVELDLPGEVDIGLLTGFRDIIGARPAEESEEGLWGRLEPAFAEAIEQFIAMRRREGEAMAADLRERFDLLVRSLQAIEDRAPGRSAAYADKLKARIAELLDGAVPDSERLYHEVALYADRIDISEECTRLRSHFEQAREIMDGPGAAGRQLNFLLQEIHREVNTLGSKANDNEISHRVVAMKEELERIREQVQNIE